MKLQGDTTSMRVEPFAVVIRCTSARTRSTAKPGASGRGRCGWRRRSRAGTSRSRRSSRARAGLMDALLGSGSPLPSPLFCYAIIVSCSCGASARGTPMGGWPRWACPSTRVRADLCRERHRFFAPSRSDRPTPQGPRRLLPRASAEDAARYRGACRYAGGPGSAPSRPEACSSRNRRAPPAHRDVLRRCGLHRVIRQARPRRPPSRAIHASFGWTVPTLVDESLSLTLSGPFSRPNR